MRGRKRPHREDREIKCPLCNSPVLEIATCEVKIGQHEQIAKVCLDCGKKK